MENVEYRLTILEKAIEDLGSRITTLESIHQTDITALKKELMEDYQKLNDEFRDLQKEYEISKNATQEKLKSLEDIPNLIQTLKDTVKDITTVLNVYKNDLEEVRADLLKEKERGHFDFISWFRDSILPALLGFGVIYFILKATKLI